jgi:hypothetical protein
MSTKIPLLNSEKWAMNILIGGSGPRLARGPGQKPSLFETFRPQPLREHGTESIFLI